jgi:hypothetical protein
MWRAFFFALGAMLIIIGIECLLIDSATLASDRTEVVQVDQGWFQPPQTVEVKRGTVIRPKEWIPWSSLATGAVILLYAFTLPRRWGAPGG